jgi:hypothetical protein
MKIVIGGLPEKNQFHRVCTCRKCGTIYIGNIKLEFRKFSQTSTGIGDPNDGYYICRDCGHELQTEWAKVEVEGHS